MKNIMNLGLACIVLAACSESSERPQRADSNAKSEYVRKEIQSDAGMKERVEVYRNGHLYESIWFVSGWPIMRTRWHSNGYGHVFEFSSDGMLLSMSEAMFGIKNGLELRISEDGSINEVIQYVDGQESEIGHQILNVTDAPLGPVREYTATGREGAYIKLREYLEQERIVESRWFLNDGRMFFRSVYDQSGYGHSCYFEDDGTITMIGEVQFGRFNGLALSLSRSGAMEFRVYVDGIKVCTR